MSEWVNERTGESTNKSPLHPRTPAPLLSSRLLIAGGLFIASFLLYLSTLAPSVVTLFDDSLEFQLVTYQLGIAHPTGYPLYTLLGKLFTLLPIGNIAYRVNLMSAFFGAATVALVYLLILQLISRSLEVWKNGRMEKTQPSHLPTFQPSNLPTFQPSNLPTFQPPSPSTFHPPRAAHFGGMIGAALLAVSPVFWQQATIAEVYTLNAFFVALLLLLAINFSLKREGWPDMLWLAFAAGLTLTHHRTILLLFPALVLYLSLKPGFWQQPHLVKTLGLSVLVSLVPLLLYLYLPLRGHVGSLDGTYQNTWAGFWRQVSAGGYSAFIFNNPLSQERDAAFYGRLLQSQVYTVIPGFMGLIYLAWQGQRKFLLLTGTAFLTYLVFNLFYNVSDIEVFFIPPFLLWAVWSGVGAGFLLRFAARTTADRGWETGDQPPTVFGLRSAVGKVPRLVMTGLIVVIFAFVIFQLFRANQPILAARNTWQVHDYGLDMLQQPVGENTAIVGILGEMTLLRYFQQTEQRRPDIETVAADIETERLAVVDKLMTTGKEVYLTRELAGAPERWSLSAVGPLIRVNPQPVRALPQGAIVVNQAVTPEISLLGYTISRSSHTGQGPAPVRLTLWWQAKSSLSASLKVSARLLNPAGEAVAAVDAVPVHFAYPTPAWRPGEVVADGYDLALPVDVLPGFYTPLLIWYDPAQNAAEVGRIELEPVQSP